MTALAESWAPPTSWPELSGTVGLDLETTELDLDTWGPGWCLPRSDAGRIIGFSVAWGAGQGYWPIGHSEGNVPSHAALGWLRDQLKKPDLTVVCHNAMYERGWLARHGIKIAGTVHDTQAAASLLNEYRRGRYNLDDTSWDYLQQRKDETALLAWGKAQKYRTRDIIMRHLAEAPAHVVGPYGQQDAVLCLNLWEHFKPLLSHQELWDIYNLELELQPVLLAMRARGVRVDSSRAEQVYADLGKLIAGLQQELTQLVGKSVAVWNAEDIAEVFDAKHLEYPMTPKTNKPSFRAQWLEAHPDPVAAQILQIRQLEKLQRVFIKGYVLEHQVNGRIYPEFNPLVSDDGGAITGRFSSSAPNLQNLPARDEMAAELIRSLMLPEEGQQWAALDYSQQEPRMMVHFGKVMGAKGVDDIIKEYHTNRDLDIYGFLPKYTSQPRKVNKIIFLGRAYGKGGGSICRDLGLPYTTYEKNGQTYMKAGPEGLALLDAFNNAVPFLQALDEECKRRARRRGWIRTILGRMCRFQQPGRPETLHWSRDYKALNKLIQGSSADQTKRAMILLHKEGHCILATVHDENGLSVADRGEAERCAEIMENCIPLHVPSKVDIALGDSWGACMKEG